MNIQVQNGAWVKKKKNHSGFLLFNSSPFAENKKTKQGE